MHWFSPRTRASFGFNISCVEFFTRQCDEYEVVSERRTWSDAERYCTQRGGRLTSIVSREENEFLQQFTSIERNDG